MQKPIKIEIECHPAAIMVISVIVAKAMDGDASLAEVLPEGKKTEILDMLAEMTAKASSAIDMNDVSLSDEQKRILSELKEANPAIKKWHDALMEKDEEDDEQLFII